MFPYDPQILAAVQAPAQSIADVLRIMQNIEDICSDLDGLKWFKLALPPGDAGRLKRAYRPAASPDSAWLAELDVLQFARLYFGAPASALSGQTSCPRVLAGFIRQPRRRCHSAYPSSRSPESMPDINHDLPEAIVATCDATSATPEYGGPQYADYTRG